MILSQPFRGTWRITQYFAVNPQVYRQFGLDGHNGVDFGINSGTEILAAVDGTIITVGDQGGTGYGKYIKLRTNDNYELTYGHLQQSKVSVGQQVHQGEVIALSDNTGFSTGPHLHFGVRQFVPGTSNIANYGNGYKGAIDPMPFFQNPAPVTPVPPSIVVTPPDPELTEAYDFVERNNIMNDQNGNTPLLRQDAARILYRFAKKFNLLDR